MGQTPINYDDLDITDDESTDDVIDEESFTIDIEEYPTLDVADVVAHP